MAVKAKPGITPAVCSAFASDLIMSAANHTESANVDFEKLLQNQKEARAIAGRERMAINNQRMKDQAAAARKNEKQIELF